MEKKIMKKMMLFFLLVTTTVAPTAILLSSEIDLNDPDVVARQERRSNQALVGRLVGDWGRGDWGRSGRLGSRPNI